MFLATEGALDAAASLLVCAAEVEPKEGSAMLGVGLRNLSSASEDRRGVYDTSLIINT